MKTRRFLGLLVAMIMLMAITIPTAFLDNSAIQIQLNGKSLDLPSGVPPYHSAEAQRIFVPFRDLFESMGATVSYDAETRMIRAERGDVTAEFSQDGRDVSVTRGGVTKVETFDVAPITMNGRTLVPVRYASLAFGALVGWDADERTVVVIDIETVLEDYADDFTIVSALLESLAVLSADAYALDMSIEIDSEDFEDAIRVSAEAIADTSAVNMTLTMDFSDLSGVMDTQEIDETFAVLLQNMKIDLIMNSDGDIFLYGDLLNVLMENEKGTWMKTTMTDVFENELDGLFDFGNSFDPFEMLVGDINDIGAYDALIEALDTLVLILGDDAFVQDGHTWINQTDVGNDGYFEIYIELNDAGEVEYLSLYAVSEEDAVEVYVNLTPNADGSADIDAQVLADAAEILMSMKITPTTKKPLTAPASGTIVTLD